MNAIQPALIQTRPISCPAGVALAEAATFTTEARVELAKWPGRESVLDAGCHALDAIGKAIAALQTASADITNTRADLETIADLLHDLAGDVAGWHKREAERPAPACTYARDGR